MQVWSCHPCLNTFNTDEPASLIIDKNSEGTGPFLPLQPHPPPRSTSPNTQHHSHPCSSAVATLAVVCLFVCLAFLPSFLAQAFWILMFSFLWSFLHSWSSGTPTHTSDLACFPPGSFSWFPTAMCLGGRGRFLLLHNSCNCCHLPFMW